MRADTGQSRLGSRLATIGVGGAFVAAAGYVLSFDPTDRVADPTGPCLWHMLTGIDGPSCGGTRMFFYLLHGNVVEAARHHLMALIAVPFAMYAFVQWSLRVWFDVSLPPLRLSKWTYLAYGIAFMLYATVLRNLPWAPFSWFYVPNLT